MFPSLPRPLSTCEGGFLPSPPTPTQSKSIAGVFPKHFKCLSFSPLLHDSPTKPNGQWGPADDAPTFTFPYIFRSFLSFFLSFRSFLRRNKWGNRLPCATLTMRPPRYTCAWHCTLFLLYKRFSLPPFLRNACECVGASSAFHEPFLPSLLPSSPNLRTGRKSRIGK